MAKVYHELFLTTIVCVSSFHERLVGELYQRIRVLREECPYIVCHDACVLQY